MSTTMVAVAGMSALVGVGAAGWLWDRVRGRRTVTPRTDEARTRYLRDGGDATYGLDQSHGTWGPS